MYYDTTGTLTQYKSSMGKAKLNTYNTEGTKTTTIFVKYVKFLFKVFLLPKLPKVLFLHQIHFLKAFT